MPKRSDVRIDSKNMIVVPAFGDLLRSLVYWVDAGPAGKVHEKIGGSIMDAAERRIYSPGVAESTETPEGRRLNR
jgi:hypothetical protein